MTLTHNAPSPLIKQKLLPAAPLSFLLGCAVSAAILLPFLGVDQGFFTYCGDYNSQQIPFYYHVQSFMRTGGGSWDWATDLGSSIINAYSFYNVGSPFLWLALLFPSRWVPFLMVPLLILKFGCIAGASCLWLQRYAKTRNMAVVSSLIFAFCGFNIYNIFFNHMLEPVIIFALMLWALDGFIYEHKRGWFAVFVGLALINSYFFFLGNVVFIILYFLVKLLCGDYRLTVKNFGLLGLEAVLGVGIGMALALPSFLNLIQNPRVDNFTSGFGFLMYGRVQQYFAIIASMFLPPDPPYLPNIFTEGAIKWTSMSMFLPIVGMGGVFAFFRHGKGRSTKILLCISLLMALVPILNSSFYAFNASYYARWYYMPLLIAALATMRALEDEDINLEWGVKLAFILSGTFVIYGLLPSKGDDDVWKLGVTQNTAKFWLTLLTALFMLGIFWVIVRYYRGRARFAPLMLAAVMGFSVFYSVIHLSLGKFEWWERDSLYREQQYEGGYALDLELPAYTSGFYRIDAYDCHDNVGLWANRSCLQTFNSTVTPSIMEFYPFVGVKRDVSSKPELTNYTLRGLLSCRFTVMPAASVDSFIAEQGTDGWRYYDTVGPFVVYENDNYLPLGFTYDEYMTMQNLGGIREEDRAPMMVRAIGLDTEQEGRYRQYFPAGQALSWEVDSSESINDGEAGGWYVYDTVDYDSYVQDVGERRAQSASTGGADSSGFWCRISMERETLVFFSVPYDEGFTATVNGQAAEIENVSGGMMAVLAPAGTNEIIFEYRTPGFQEGLAISLLSLAALGGYVGFVWWWRRRKRATPVDVDMDMG